MNRNYPLNCWYVAALSDEVGFEPMARRLLDQDVVLYRRESDDVVALEDRCAHRNYPLSKGRVEGDNIVCGYHGCVYGPNGKCVRVLSQDKVPTNASVKAFPIVERGPFVWIWLGNPRASTLRTPPRVPWLSESGWASSVSRSYVSANFLLLHEHYLDLTHAFVMHPQMVPPGITELPPLDAVEVSEMSVSYTRSLAPAPLAEWEQRSTRLPSDRNYERTEQGVFVSPALHVERYTIHAEATGYEHLRIQAFTPESPVATHVFMQFARNYAQDRSPVTQYLKAQFDRLGSRDKEVLETLESRRDTTPPGSRSFNVTADRAAIRARTIVISMVAEESGRSPVRPAFAN